MKKSIAGAMAAGLLGCSAHAQGTVNFVNLSGGAGLNAPVFLADGITRATGPAWVAGLYAGTTSANLAYIGNETPFLTGGGAGYFNGGTTVLPGIPGGTTGWFEVFVWDSTLGGTTTGATLAQAIASGVYGHSTLFSVVAADPTTSPPQTPSALVGLQSFYVPEPSALSLAGLGLAVLLCCRRK